MRTPDIFTEPCLRGRLASAYPASRNDVEVRVRGVAGDHLSAALAKEAARVIESDPLCRKVIYAASAGDLEAVSAAEAAGFRYVVDVDIVDSGQVQELSLLVHEPQFVTRIDEGSARIPQT